MLKTTLLIIALVATIATSTTPAHPPPRDNDPPSSDGASLSSALEEEDSGERYSAAFKKNAPKDNRCDVAPRVYAVPYFNGRRWKKRDLCDLIERAGCDVGGEGGCDECAFPEIVRRLRVTRLLQVSNYADFDGVVDFTDATVIGLVPNLTVIEAVSITSETVVTTTLNATIINSETLNTDTAIVEQLLVAQNSSLCHTTIGENCTLTIDGNLLFGPNANIANLPPLDNLTVSVLNLEELNVEELNAERGTLCNFDVPDGCNFTFLGDLSVTGALSVGGDIVTPANVIASGAEFAFLTVEDTLNVAGDAVVGDLTANSASVCNQSVTCSLTVEGPTTLLGDAEISEDLDVGCTVAAGCGVQAAGTSTINDLVVTGSLTLPPGFVFPVAPFVFPFDPELADFTLSYGSYWENNGFVEVSFGGLLDQAAIVTLADLDGIVFDLPLGPAVPSSATCTGTVTGVGVETGVDASAGIANLGVDSAITLDLSVRGTNDATTATLGTNLQIGAGVALGLTLPPPLPSVSITAPVDLAATALSISGDLPLFVLCKYVLAA